MTATTTLADTANAVAKSLRLRGSEARLSPSGREARILVDGKTLAYIHRTGRGIRVHVQHNGREERVTCSTAKDAARVIKTSERRRRRRRQHRA